MIEKCSGAVGFEAVATEHRWVVHISGGSVGRGDLTPDREAVGHLGSPFGRAEQMPSRPEVCGDAAEGGQEPLGMPRRFEAFHRPFALSGGLMRVLGAVVQIPALADLPIKLDAFRQIHNVARQVIDAFDTHFHRILGATGEHPFQRSAGRAATRLWCPRHAVSLGRGCPSLRGCAAAAAPGRGQG